MTVASAVYQAMPPWAQDVVVTGYGAWLQFLRYGPGHRRELSRLLSSQWWDTAQFEQFQLDQLRIVIGQAYRAVPMYRERGPAPRLTDLRGLGELPIIRRADLKAAKAAAVSETRRGIPVEIHTGGSTGTPLTVYSTHAALRLNYAFFARLKAWAGIAPGDRVATFAGRTIVPQAATSRFWRHNHVARTLLCSSYHLSRASVAQYVAKLAEYRPALIDSYPSSLEPLARYIVSGPERPVHPKAIITSSETLFPEARMMLEEAFRAPIFDHYGSAEMVAFITQCERGRYHANPEYGVVELIRNGRMAEVGEIGEIVATGFVNPSMPLIRYATGDFASWSSEPCACGRAMPVIERIEGRMDDVIDTPEGHEVGRLDPIFKAVSVISEARIVQDEISHVRVEVVAPDGLPDGEREALAAELRRRLGPSMRIDLVVVPSIFRTGRGKLKTVVNLLRSESVP